MTRVRTPLYTIAALSQAHAATSLITSAEFSIPEANNGATFFFQDAQSGTLSIEGYICGGWFALESSAISHTGSATAPSVVDFTYVLPERLRVKFTPGSSSSGTAICNVRVRVITTDLKES